MRAWHALLIVAGCATGGDHDAASIDDIVSACVGCHGREDGRRGGVRANTKIPPGPGMIPASGDSRIRITPIAKIDHSTTGWSIKRCHRSRVHMRRHVGKSGRLRKSWAAAQGVLAYGGAAGLAVVRRARGMVDRTMPRRCRE